MPRVTAFERGLTELGWVSGRNVLMDYRWAAGEYAHMQVLAKELVELQPDVLLASSTPVVAALARETGTIPIVFVVVFDPIGSGFIESLARPGGNMTGFINIESSLGGKWLELLKELAPSISRVAVMFNPDTAPHAEYYVRPFEVAAASLAVKPSHCARSQRHRHRTSHIRPEDALRRAASSCCRTRSPRFTAERLSRLRRVATFQRFIRFGTWLEMVV